MRSTQPVYNINSSYCETVPSAPPVSFRAKFTGPALVGEYSSFAVAPIFGPMRLMTSSHSLTCFLSIHVFRLRHSPLSNDFHEYTTTTNFLTTNLISNHPLSYKIKMRASTVVALALIAAAAPALAAPATENVYARDTADESGAFKIDTGLIKDGVSIANGVIDGINGIKNIFE